MKKIKVTHKREKCIGCHSCVDIAPQSWVIDMQDGKSRLIGSKQKGDVMVGEIFECDKAKNEVVARACPMQIIKVC